MRGPSDVQSVESGHLTCWRWRKRRFAVIGWGYVALMTLIFLISSVWSLLLIILNLEPSKSANFILQTESLDNGHFWQSRKANSSILVTTTSLLLIVIGVYWYLLYLLLIRPPSNRVYSEELKPKLRNFTIRKIPTVDTIVEQRQQVTQRSLIVIARRVVRGIVMIYRSVVSPDGKYRKVWNVLMEVPEVILQILSLREYMAQGLDSSLLYCYASLMALNAFVAFYHIQFRWNESTLHHILKDSIVDAAFAVFFPALILLYSLFVFQDDLKSVKIRQQFFPPRGFERKARNLVNAKELNMFSTDFESLLVLSEWDVFLKLSFSLLACFRWNKITHLLLQRERKGRNSQEKTTDGAQKSHSTRNCKAVAPLPVEKSTHDTEQSGYYPSSRLRTMVGIFFMIYGVGCLIYTGISVQVSRSSCSRYPTCVQFAHRWIPGGSSDVCECLAYVDRDLAPADAENLTDVTNTLAVLASAGKLQTVQLVNRRINGSLPDELQNCQLLRNLVLIHTGVEVFPSWVSTSFAKLEYLHVEGESTDTNLVELPSDLFFSMGNLHTIHLSYHANLPSLPSMVGLKTLESVYFGYLDNIKEIPSTADLPEIQVMALEGLPLVRSLPDVTQYESTLDMMFVQDVPVCCSGFLSEGFCNTTFPSCCEEIENRNGSNTGSSLPPTCLVLPDEESLLPTNATLSFLSQFAVNVSNFCEARQATCPNAVKASKRREKDTCQGVLYRECLSQSQGTGICFNEDMGRVECTYSQSIIEMREAEITAGCSCDEVEEQWLGCTA
ncbi:hypothetical protein PC110_g8547 [Phytophthora cactorum]|uniref:WLGC domain-containing protein n=2 Tax=Phytophthora cactorum TaxID=29920 RepID=A0A329SEQ3_9STRA|nr:hypothetical protein PC110_g8547 [Phytophthora cactorum]